MKKSEFLLEIYSEEIPSFLQERYSNILKEYIIELFESKNISYSNIANYSGPCRLVIYASNVNNIVIAQNNLIKGPKVSAPDIAIEKLCSSNSISKSDLKIEKINDIEYYVINSLSKEESVKGILEQKLPEILKKIVWPKSMLWGNNEISWIRPLKNILCLFDSEIINFQFGHLKSNNLTSGHKFLRPDLHQVNSYNEYKEFLYNNFVILDQNERREIIKKQLDQKLSNMYLTYIIDNRLVDEVNGLVEWPEILVGSIDKEFLKIPNEILSTTIRVHQKYFTLLDNNQIFAPYFAFVCNVLENHKEVIQGNEKVLCARLNDALFFYNQDCKNTLSSKLKSLKKLSFHKNAGNLFDKSLRIEKICQFLDSEDKNLHIAASLSKCDLLTEIVTEFPNLQGIMGAYYAINDGLDKQIADAIRDHYMPVNIDDMIPQNRQSQLLSLADKFDNLVILHHAGERATGSKDPMALRRSAISIIRVILDGKHKIDIIKIVKFILSLVENNSDNNLADFIVNFIEERLKYYLKDKYDKKYLDSIIDLKQNPDIYSLISKLEIIVDFMNSQKGAVISQIYNRVINILSDKASKSQNIDKKLFKQDEEKSLYNSINEIYPNIQQFIQNSQYNQALNMLISLQNVTNNFFDNVLVNSDDILIIQNRKALLSRLKDLFDMIGDFSFTK